MLRPSALAQIRRKTVSYWKYVANRVIREQDALQSLDDTSLRKESLSLLYRAQAGESLDDLLLDAFKLVREAARRTVQMEHYPVQLIGGAAMHFGSIAVMQTGEGKTLTATLPMYLASLNGQGCHLATANDYLAARDADFVKPIFNALGRSIGVVTGDSHRIDRIQAYEADITYSTAKEIGFDFLRDRLLQRRFETVDLSRDFVDSGAGGAASANRPVQRNLHFMLVDEADSILIDEARTPLVVSALPDAVAQARAALYQWSAEQVGCFIEGEHYEFDDKTRRLQLNAKGRQHLRKLPHPDAIAEMPLLDIYEFVEQAIFVSREYQNERHYVIRDEEVVIVDEFTGRLAEGRKWRAGMHQAIEAKEGLEVSLESGDAARVTIQDLFLKYDRLAGMTGTVASSARELEKIYRLRSIHVPTNRPPKRKQLPDRVFGSEEAKWSAIADEIESVSRTGRPVLVGTRSIDKSETLSRILAKREIKHQVLNAVHVEMEAEIVEAAGGQGKVTVATNMAGRGTDIRLDETAFEAGGLHVICSELHESARIDRQLIGRCGRQGDPGSFRQYICLEDDLLEKAYGELFAKRIRKHMSKSEKELLRFALLFRRAQAKIERAHFKSRKMLLYYDRKRQELQIEMGQDPYLDAMS